MIKCGITGSTGILGTEIIKNLPYKFIRFKGNITSISDIKKWLDENNFHIIIHLSSIVPVNEVNKNYLYAKRVNYIGTKNLVDLILKSKTKPSWFFFASTSHVYKTTKNLKKISETSKNSASSRYGHTKKLAENYIRNQLKSKKIKYCIGRIFSFTHKNQKKSFVVPSLYLKIKFNKKIILKNLNH